MNNLIIAVVAWFIAEGSGLMQQLKYKLCISKIWCIYPDGKDFPETRQQKRLKPLDCPLCLAFWMSLIYNFFETYDPTMAILNAILSSSMAIFISKIYYKL